jgi:hypothetical protein
VSVPGPKRDEPPASPPFASPAWDAEETEEKRLLPPAGAGVVRQILEGKGIPQQCTCRVPSRAYTDNRLDGLSPLIPYQYRPMCRNALFSAP